jgi:hypothetical protein
VKLIRRASSESRLFRDARGLSTVEYGKVLIERANGSRYERRARRNDTVPGPQVSQPPGGSQVNLNSLQC